jgi:hypothetical protein
MRENLFPHRLLGAGETARNASDIKGEFPAATLNKKYANALKSTT